VLHGDEPGGMITIQDGHMVPLPLGSAAGLTSEAFRDRYDYLAER
jgi:hypothetical protein